jgi:hypothetical protein
LVGLEGSPTMVVEIFTPPPRPGGKMISGEPAVVAAEAIREMHAMGIV